MYAKGKLFLKAIEGELQVQSVSLHDLKEKEGRPVRKYINSKGITMIDMKGGVSTLHKFTKEMSVFKLGKSDVVYWIDGPLPLGEHEYAPAIADEKKKRDDRYETKDKDREREKREREKRRERERRSRKREDSEDERDRRERDRRDRDRDRGDRDRKERSRSRRRR